MPELGALLTLEYGEAMPAEARSGHGYPVFGSNGEVGRHRDFLVPESGIIVGRKGSAGKVTWSNGPFWPIDTTYWVKCAPEDRRWIYWVLNWLPLARLDSSTGIPGLNRNDVYALSVDRPSLNERKKIVEILDTVEAIIQKTEALIDNLKAIKQGLLHDLLTRGIDANGQLRPLQTDAPRRYKPSPLGWVPKEWGTKAVSDVAEVKSGTTPSRGHATRYFAEAGVPWVKTLDLNEDVILQTDEQVTGTALRETSLAVFPQGTVLVAMYGGWEQIGRTALLGIPACTNQAISALVFNPEQAVPEFMLRAMQHGRSRWQSVAASTRKDPNITKTDVLAFELPLPSLDEQAEIVLRIRSVLDQLHFERDLLTKLKREKSALMDDLLTGRVRVTPLLKPTPA